MTQSADVSADDLHAPPTAPGMRIGLLGGSFNPPHDGHRLISLTVLKRLRLNKVWWLVTPGNPLKDHGNLAPLRHRLQLCRAMKRDSRIEITALEAALGSAYTAETLAYLQGRFSRVHFVWVMGADNLASFHRWRGWRHIFETMPMAVVDRPHWRYRALASPAAHKLAAARVPEHFASALPGLAAPAWTYLSGPLSALSSTDIRQRW